MRRILTVAILGAVLLNLGGCVLAVGNGDAGDDSSWNSSDYRDSDLAHAVRQGLAADPATHDVDIRVSAEHGRVYLEGTVDSSETLAKAVQIALDTADVKSVRCRITVIKK